MGSFSKIEKGNIEYLVEEMKNKITCAIDYSLEITLPETSNLNCVKIASNEDPALGESSYSILLLNKNNFKLYTETRFTYEEEFDAVGYYNPALNNPEDVIEACRVLDEILSRPAVITYQQITTLMKLHILIYDGDPRRIKGASYDLEVDKEHLKSGSEIITEDNLDIDPFDFIVVSAMESVNLPKNI